MFNPIKASKNIKDEFISYISTSFHIADKDYARFFEEELRKHGAVSKGPYLEMNDSFESGKSIENLIGTEMSPLFHELEQSVPEQDKEIKLQRPLYKHQESAICKINRNKNLVVTTGTGSGKTECFILPIINHLLREKEKGTLNDGVRAILIYPMNALANDQMKRLRLILKEYPGITFGVYNSSTKQEDESGIAEYGRVFKDKDGRAQKPLPNEAISRKRMQTHPPHILVTNYAMLEYMMLRPKDDAVFSGANLRFIVLDEAHIYRGATGIETSLLLRRLKARISNPSNVLHILTSATLGGKEADNDIVSFASTLCDARFDVDDIVRSKTIAPEFPEESFDYPLEMFERLVEPDDSLNAIFKAYGVKFDSTKSDSEILYDLCISSKAYRILRECATHPMTINQITKEMRRYMDIKDSDVVNLIHIASKAEKNKTALVKARYHMFVRALEGAYITLEPFKKLYLTRRNYVKNGEETRKVFEAAVCNDCGRIGIAGRTVNNFLESTANRNDEKLEMYIIRNQNEEFDINETDDSESDEIGREAYLICAVCGEIHHESQNMDFRCGHGTENIIRIREAQRQGSRNEGKCPCCNFGHLKLFYIGYDAATAVLGTELFEQLPEREKVLETRKVLPVQGKNLFSKSLSSKKHVDEIRRKRQFLAFSDSRSDAAFYACYMTSFYQEFLRRRGLWHVIEENKESISKEPWEISTLVNELTAYFDSNKTFVSPEDGGKKNLTPESEKQAWIAVLNEMVNARRSTSLVSLGFLDFEYKGNSEGMMKNVAEEYGIKPKDAFALFNIIVSDFLCCGAIEGERCNLTDDQREYIYYSSRPRRFKKCKEKEIDKKKTYLNGFLPREMTNGKLYRNGRISRTCNVLNISEKEANDLLGNYWEYVLVGGDSEVALTPDGNGEFYFTTDKFRVVIGDKSRPVYRCEKCGKTTMINCMDRCIILKCDGKLRPVSHDSLIKDNHFARLYSEKLMSPLHIKEHTAQLGRKDQQKYQEMFINKEINALSCSTTFEMGVDVGDLETVYLRNIPPSPANYVQRAGRAGRSIHSAAYALTYSKLSSHDFTYFDDPIRMISGKIGVPLFSISNKKVIQRHIFAVALSDFFDKNEDVYNDNNADILLNQDGYERLKKYLAEHPDSLKGLLKDSIPSVMHEKMGINDWSWVDNLTGESGILQVAVNDFRNTVEWYEKEIKRLKRIDDLQGATKYDRQLKEHRRNSEDKRGRNELIEFLVRYNVLPKYGFPVDTVELFQNANSEISTKLQMARDLQLAVAEYAPGAQVVADGKLYTSRYIRKLPQTTGQDWNDVYIAQCNNPSCMTWNYRDAEVPKGGVGCVSCGANIIKSRWKESIEPRKGFIAEPNPKEVPLRKPERSYRGDDHYIGDPMRKVTEKRTFEISDNEKLQMETSADDSLLVVCNDNFFVCDRCGYAISSTSEKDENDFEDHKKTYVKEHEAPWGKKCKGILKKKKLCHSFKTDVIRLTFGTSRAKNQATMLSVMYALLEATSKVLAIERTDIKGCLHKVKYGRKMIFEIVLYDAVAGGAGHVRRLMTEDCAVLQKIIKCAIEITKGCSCDPSCYNCLRNYYNQHQHEKLNRIEAYSFLEHYFGDVKLIDNSEFEQGQIVTANELSESNVRFMDGYDCSDYKNWTEFSPMIPEEYMDEFKDMDFFHIPLPSESYCKIIINGSKKSSEILFMWKNQKVIVFDNDTEKLPVNGWNTMNVNDIKPAKFVELFNGGN